MLPATEIINVFRIDARHVKPHYQAAVLEEGVDELISEVDNA
jgi:hypothetical protein